jgi:hypothetical protein
MAQKVTVVLEDDLDGGAADETVRFGLAGALYELDLNAKDAARFRKQPDPSSSMPRSRTGAGPWGGRRQAVRAAAASGCGRKIRASRSALGGAIPASVVEQYEAAIKGR